MLFKSVIEESYTSKSYCEHPLDTGLNYKIVYDLMIISALSSKYNSCFNCYRPDLSPLSLYSFISSSPSYFSFSFISSMVIITY